MSLVGRDVQRGFEIKAGIAKRLLQRFIVQALNAHGELVAHEDVIDMGLRNEPEVDQAQDVVLEQARRWQVRHDDPHA
ncbi:hypothetical protein D3C80_1198570 [compost metagenome]